MGGAQWPGNDLAAKAVEVGQRLAAGMWPLWGFDERVAHRPSATVRREIASTMLGCRRCGVGELTSLVK